MTAPDLAQNVPRAEAVMVRHKEHQAEIDTFTFEFTKFCQAGHRLIAEGHFLAHEIEEKISILEQHKQLLNDTWARRKAIYDQNQGTKVQCHAAGLQSWEPLLYDGKLGEAITQVDDSIRKHEDFEKTVQAQEEKFSALQHVTTMGSHFVFVSVLTTASMLRCCSAAVAVDLFLT